MTHFTPGKPKLGRHPATWQSVPIGSFIRPSSSQHAIPEDHSELASSSDPSKKDMSGVKYFPPKKKDMFQWNRNNGPRKSEEVEDKTSCCNQKYGTRSNSTQRYGFPKRASNATVHPTSQKLTFLSNDDDFPSLSSASNSKSLQTTISTQQTAQAANISYSEKLKLVQQHSKVEHNSTSTGKERSMNVYQKNSISHALYDFNKDSSVENKKDHRSTSTPTNMRDLPKSQWNTSHRTNKKNVFADAKDDCHLNQMNVSPIDKVKSKNQREKSPYSQSDAAKEIYEISKDRDAKSLFMSRSRGSHMQSNFDTRPRDMGGGGKMNVSDTRCARNARTEVKNDTWSSKLASKSKRPVMSEVKGKCLSPEVPTKCGNVPNSASVGKRRVYVQNNVSQPSKVASKNSIIAEGKSKNCNDSELAVKTPKKRKNRKSKLKRNLAFQTGKIMILTPELYSRFTGNLSVGQQKTMQDCSFDLTDMEEYPTLGEVNNISSDYHKKSAKPESMDSFTNGECDTGRNSPPVSSKRVLFRDEINSEECNTVSETSTSHLLKTIPGSRQNVQSITDKVVQTTDTDKYGKPCCAPRKRIANLDSTKSPAAEEKDSSLTSDQKTKNRHDSSIQISFSDILSSTMVKVKSETSKNKKQNDSRVKVISSKKVKMDKNLHLPPNALDSSRPVVKRGKERERPKPKKHTVLKRIILKERSEKKLRRSMLVKQENLKNGTECQNDAEVIIPSSPVPVVDNDVFPADDELKTEQPVETTSDLELSLFDDFCVEEEISSEFRDISQNDNVGENLNISVEIKDESLCEKVLEEICNPLSPEDKKMQAIQIAIHTRHFREYCNHLLSADIDQVTLALLGDLTRFQDRLHQKDPVKARIKRRLVYGIKEVTKHLRLKRVKCVILAPDSENITSKGGLNDAVSEIVRVSGEYHIPCVFALRRKTLGKACLKPVPVACVGVFNYDGSEANFKKLLELQAESRKAYDAVMTNMKELISKEEIDQLIEAQESSPQSLQSLRITILREKLLEKNQDLHLVFTPSGNVQIGCKEE